MESTERILLKLFFSVLLFLLCYCDPQPSILNPGILTPIKIIGDCLACKIFVESFEKGLKRTERGKYEGGDTAWEEEKFKVSYRRSEVRLIDIQDGLCKDESKYSVQCHSIAEKAEEFIEEWWSQNPDDPIDLHSHICIEKLEVCCPKLHYGRNCRPCRGNLANLCNGNGKCRGDGTRKGNGTCLCDEGYIGEQCNSCDQDYYVSYKDENKNLCSHCHRSCTGGCRGGSQKDCVACKPGYTSDLEHGCVDNNECSNPNICNTNEFCVNSLGSYSCLLCDKSCDGCDGDGPDSCNKCAKGFTKKGEMCLRDEILTIDRLSVNRKEDL